MSDDLPQEARERFKIARAEYLLTPDAALRAAAADGLTVVVSARARRVPLPHWREAVATTSFVVAAYLRGEDLPLVYVERLRELRRTHAKG